MIFGFNTDIKVESTVYHVQSEERAAEKLLQTQVFVKGHCIGKRARSYAAEEAQGQTDETRHDLLREQHRSIVQAIREGRVDDVIESASAKLAANVPGAPAAAPAATPAPAAPPSAPAQGPAGIELKFLGSSRPNPETFTFKFNVALAGSPASGATILAQILPESAASETFSGGSARQQATDAEGMVEVSLPIPPNAQGEANLVVQVSHDHHTVAKKFRIKLKA